MVSVPPSASCVEPMTGRQDNAFLAEKDMCFKEGTAFDLHWESTKYRCYIDNCDHIQRRVTARRNDGQQKYAGDRETNQTDRVNRKVRVSLWRCLAGIHQGVNRLS